MLQQGFSKLSAIGSKVLQRCPEGVVRGSFRFLQLGYCARPAGKKNSDWPATLHFLNYRFMVLSRPCLGLRVLAWIMPWVPTCLECRQHLMNQLSAKSYFWGRGICRKLDPNLTHTFHTFLNFIIDIVINKHHFKNKLWLRVVNNFPHVSQSNIHSG